MSPPLLYTLGLIVCSLGHAMIWVRAINWMHGVRSQKAWTGVVRTVLRVILVGIPIFGMVMLIRSGPESFWDEWPVPYNWMAWAYVALTGVMGLIYFPYLWISYLLRKPPVGTRHTKSEVFNVGRALGKRPIGKGKRGWLAKMPFNQIYEVDLTEKELVLPRLPAAWDGLRILHLTDLHFCGRPSKAYFERVFHLCSKRGCDVLVLTGDLVDSDKHYDWLYLLKMFKPTQCTLAIRGNHDAKFDYAKVNTILGELGSHVLGGQSKVITLKGEPLLVAGNEVPWLEPIPDLSGHHDQDCFRLALIHSPDQFRWAVRQKFDLVLAGHNHGGQIRMPAFGSIFVPSKTGRRYDMGLFQSGSTVLHVSRGVSGGHPIRYFCRPEAAWLTLRSPKSA
ncbi:MAG: metallophosphoesterase [Gemmatales bacterium]